MRARPFFATALVAAFVSVSLWGLAGEPSGAPLRRVRPPALRDAGARPISKTPPDPPPLSEKVQWVFDLKWDRGSLYLMGVREEVREEATPTPRVMGRFALELFEGPALLERVRFDFPMMAVSSPDGGLENVLSSRVGVYFPKASRGTRLVLVDRLKDLRYELAFPPEARTPRDAGGP